MSLIRQQELGRWRGMLRRCENPRDGGYRYYGARGIKVCEQWHDFEVYYADIMRLLGPCPWDKTLDRIDNDGNYEPGNVRWATSREQSQNSRSCGPQTPEQKRHRAELRESRRARREAERQAAEARREKTLMVRPADACAALGIDRKECLRLIYAGELAAIRLSDGPRANFRIIETSLEAYIARHLPDRIEVSS